MSGTNKLIEGGVYDQTMLILKSIEKIVNASGSAMKYITNLKVFVTNNTPARYKEMNSAYVQFFKDRGLPVCSRITVGCSAVKSTLSKSYNVSFIAIFIIHSVYSWRWVQMLKVRMFILRICITIHFHIWLTGLCVCVCVGVWWLSS